MSMTGRFAPEVALRMGATKIGISSFVLIRPPSNGARDAHGANTYVLCEINASSCFGIRDEAPAAIARAAIILSAGRHGGALMAFRAVRVVPETVKCLWRASLPTWWQA
jgi:hypothetical protein